MSHDLETKFIKLAGLCESSIVEFKENNASPEDIGQYISALSNSALLDGSPCAWMLWGVRDATNDIVGTTFNPFASKVGNQELISWLHQKLKPNINFKFSILEVYGKNCVLLEIPTAHTHPTRFENISYIRVGTYKKPLNNFPNFEKQLWNNLNIVPFEKGVAVYSIPKDDIVNLIKIDVYFDLLNTPSPSSLDTALDYLIKDSILIKNPDGTFNISNLGALLFASNLNDFPSIKRKAIRVIQYSSNNKIAASKDTIGNLGYAIGFQGLIRYINALLSETEIIVDGIRKSSFYPDLSIREIIANAIIHQDFSKSGVSPTIEIFPDRIEITNPGIPLIAIDRFLDNPPISRNEILASLMRRFGICEERGSGIDKVVAEAEKYQLPAPTFDVIGDFTQVNLYFAKNLSKLSKEERIRICYLHACFRWVSMRDSLTNSSLRQRFNIEEKNKAIISRLIKEAVDAKVIKPADLTLSKKMMRYIPYWV